MGDTADVMIAILADPPSPGRGSATTRIVLGPYTAYTAAACSRPFLPISWSPGQMPKMLPTAKLAATMLLPSKGSNATCNTLVCGFLICDLKGVEAKYVLAMS